MSNLTPASYAAMYQHAERMRDRGRWPIVLAAIVWASSTLATALVLVLIGREWGIPISPADWRWYAALIALWLFSLGVARLFVAIAGNR